MNLLKGDVKGEESLQIEKSLLEGVVSRAGTLFFTWSFIGVLYGFLSFELFRKKMPNLTLWENVWPRILFSALPVFGIAFLYKKNKKHTKLKAYFTIILLPVFLISSAMIHAWPLFWSGEYDFYLLFHASNIVAMSSGIFVISASPRMVLAQCVGFIIIFFGPLFFLFSKGHPELSLIIFSDSLIATIILMVTLKAIHKLRVTVAVDELRRRHKSSLFLGKRLADAIYENQKVVPDDFSRDGLIMSVDLRGYTKFFQLKDQLMVRSFMSEYYSMVTKILATRKAYLHKTIGDGLLISFGVMDNEEDLSDLPEDVGAQTRLEERKKADCLRFAVESYLQIAQGLEVLSQKHKVALPLTIGAGCAYGPIEILVRGDETFRQELDIQGSTIIKSVRLEAYSKLLTQKIDDESSFLLLAPELISHVPVEQGFKTLMINESESAVRDFPEIKMMLYRQWKHRSPRSGLKVA